MERINVGGQDLGFFFARITNETIKHRHTAMLRQHSLICDENLCSSASCLAHIQHPQF